MEKPKGAVIVEPNSDKKFSSEFGRTIKIMQYIGSRYSGSVFSDVFVRIRTKNLAFQTSFFSPNSHELQLIEDGCRATN